MKKYCPKCGRKIKTRSHNKNTVMILGVLIIAGVVNHLYKNKKTLNSVE